MSDKKIALVTGGAQGIGLACATALMEDGARPILCDINEERVLEAANKLGNEAVGILLCSRFSRKHYSFIKLVQHLQQNIVGKIDSNC